MNCSIANSQSWNIAAPYAGSPIDDGVGFSIGDVGYVGTGRDAGFQYRSDFYKFENEQWEQIANINGTPRQYATSFSFPNTGCIVTGLAPQDSLLNEIQCYSVGNDEWHIKSPFPGLPRLQATSFTIGEMGFCGGGRNLQENFQDWYKFDFLANSWSPIKDFPDKRFETVSFTINGIGYVGLGTTNFTEYHNDFYTYNPLNDEWTKIETFPGDNRIYSCAFAIGNKGYVCTGYNESLELSSEVWCYNPEEDSWTQVEDFPFQKIKGCSQFTIDNCAFVTTGIDALNVRQNTNYSFCDSENYENKILIFPNPASEIIALTSSLGKEFTLVEIIDINGKKVLERISNNNYIQINVSSLQKGMYIMKINTSDQKVTTQKLVIY